MKIIHTLINWLVVAGILAVGASYFMKKQLPPPEALVPETFQYPVQENRTDGRFIFDYRGTSYQVSPVADYELWGLIVSHNDIGRFGDIYHTEDSVDLKDVCVVWGDNTKSGVYREGSYRSGSWTCYWQFSNWSSWTTFSESQIANNHLIASAPEIQEKIRGLRIGDQVHIKGVLADYENLNTGWRRETSLTRNDTGNGACEVIHVESVEILKPGNVYWYLASYWGKWALLGLIALKILLVVGEAYCDTKKLQKEAIGRTSPPT